MLRGSLAERHDAHQHSTNALFLGPGHLPDLGQRQGQVGDDQVALDWGHDRTPAGTRRLED